MTKFDEAKLEQAILSLLETQGYPHTPAVQLDRALDEVLLESDLRAYLLERYGAQGLTDIEVSKLIQRLRAVPAGDLYEANKRIHHMVSDGLLLKRDDPKAKDLHIELIDYAGLPEQRPPKPGELEVVDAGVAESAAPYRVDKNRYRVVSQLVVDGHETRKPDAVLYINGLPLVVFEFKSAIRENATIHDAWWQLHNRYARDIPELMKYCALCVISDGVNSRVGSLFATYQYFYPWRKITGDEPVGLDGIDALHTLIQGLFDPDRLRQVLRHFIHFPDNSHADLKIVPRYPQFYAATKLFQNILAHRKRRVGSGADARIVGDGKGGTYFGATGSGKSYTMLFLTRMLMKSVDLGSPTIVLITDRTDLDDQLSATFAKATQYIGDDTVMSVKSRAHLRELLGGRTSGGVFLTTVHKFTEDTELLTDRTNVVCISDEAHRSQTNLKQKVKVTEQGIKRTWGFAKHLHDSLPNATYVGFSGTPIDATLDVFGPVVDAYTMTESVADEITVRLVYEGRAAKVLLDNGELEKIEAYYAQCADEGSNEQQIEESKKANAKMHVILADPDRIRAIAADFVEHYERRVSEGATVAGKALFVCSKRDIAWQLWQEIVALRPGWNKALAYSGDEPPSAAELKKLKPLERVKMIMTRHKDDAKELYELLGDKDHRKELDRQFKIPRSNFQIAIVVDMWLTGFDVPFLDTIYIDKPISRHNLIQTISRVNRTYAGKTKGLVVDYFGIKTQMNLALAHYSKVDKQNIEEITLSVVTVRNELDLLAKLFHHFDDTGYFDGDPLAQLNCLNQAAEYAQLTDKLKRRFLARVKRMKAAYDICCGGDDLTPAERDRVHFYLAVRSILLKLTKGHAPDTATMNAKVREMMAEALKASGVEEVFKLGEDEAATDLFDPDYLAKISKIKLPNTKFMLLQRLLKKAIDDFKKVNKAKGIDFTEKLTALVLKYNERKEEDVLVSEVLEDFTDEILVLLEALRVERESFVDLGIDLEEKAFYDILKALTLKYDFAYPEDKLLTLASCVKEVVDDKAKYTDWSARDDIKAELKVDLILLLAKHGYPPVDRDEVYQEIFEQAENFKRYRADSQ